MHRQQGFTLTELLVTLGVFGILAAIAFSLYASSAKLISSDQGRINTNQNLRTSLDLITQDLRAAGESLPSSFRFSGVDFNAATDSLTVRRGISIPVLSVCDSVSSSSSSIKVTGKPSGATGVPAQCTFSDVGGPTASGSNGISDKIDPWMTYKAQSGNTYIPAILYNPANQSAARIQISTISNTNLDGGTTTLRLSGTAGSGGFSYTNGSVIVPVDERRYSRVGEELQLTVNEDPASLQTLGFGITDLGFNAVTTDTSGSVPVSTNNASFTLTSAWRTVSRIDLSVTGANVVSGSKSTPRTLSVSVFPRNVIQAQ